MRLENELETGQNDFCMRDLGLRSPFVQVGGLVYFARMLDKIRALRRPGPHHALSYKITAPLLARPLYAAVAAVASDSR